MLPNDESTIDINDPNEINAGASGSSSNGTDDTESLVQNKKKNSKELDVYINQVMMNMEYGNSNEKLTVPTAVPQTNGSIALGVILTPTPDALIPTNTQLTVVSALTLPGTVHEPGPAQELILACETNKVKKVKTILATGIDSNAVCDEKGRWPIHIAAAQGFTEIVLLLLASGAQRDQPDVLMERTPLHLASMASADTVEILLRNGADVNAKNKYGSNALHYSAGAGQVACSRLLCKAGCHLNSRDRNRLTPLHVAARVGDVWCIEVLLEYGADFNAKDKVGKAPLHHACEGAGGSAGGDESKSVLAIRRLVAAGADVNQIDNEGKSPLFYGVTSGSADALRGLHDLGATLNDGATLLMMSHTFPHLVRQFLDQSVKSNIDSFDPDSKSFYIQFDYTALTYYPKGVPETRLLSLQNRDETETLLNEMGVLNGLTKVRDTSILTHPICESLLKLKWKKVRWYLYADMLLYAIFLSFLTAVIFIEYEADDEEANYLGNDTWQEHLESLNLTASKSNIYCMDTPSVAALWSILWCLTSVLAIREIVQMFRGFLSYFMDIENLLEVSLLISVALLSFAECGIGGFVSARDHFAAVCLIFGWTIQVLLYGKIPLFGVYIRMYSAVARSILYCLFTYLGLLFAFSLTLHFLFRKSEEFNSVWFTFLKTFAMMIGELDLSRTFIMRPVHVPFTSHFIFALFMVFISVILSSLLVSLAVSAISNMQRDLDYLQLVQLINVTSQLEDMLKERAYLYPRLKPRDPKTIKMRKGIIYPNMKDYGKLSKDAMEIVINQNMRRKTNAAPKTSAELTEDLLQKLRVKLDKYILDVEKKGDRMAKELRTYEKYTERLVKEVRSLKYELESVNQKLGVISNAFAEPGAPDN